MCEHIALSMLRNQIGNHLLDFQFWFFFHFNLMDNWFYCCTVFDWHNECWIVFPIEKAAFVHPLESLKTSCAQEPEYCIRRPDHWECVFCVVHHLFSSKTTLLLFWKSSRQDQLSSWANKTSPQKSMLHWKTVNQINWYRAIGYWRWSIKSNNY